MRLPYANMTIKHRNPGATADLILPVTLLCNTPDEEIHSNIRENSRKQDYWLREVPAHNGVAVLCGSGPSLADHLPQIRALQRQAAQVFAMNGAAQFLADHDIWPDYQVIIDPRPQTADLVGPARFHLFASQVSPECFRRVPYATLWHLQIEGIDDLLPDNCGMLTLIGGAASVGNTACCLVYAMGYRHLEIFGYDSSHRGDKGHAFDQPMNAGDPCCYVDFDGKKYLVSLTMKMQAERFQDTSRELINAGVTINVHGDGLLPAMYRNPGEVLAEAEKYRRMWEHEIYRHVSPGEAIVDLFLEVANPRGTVIDFGCGTGRAALKIAETNPVILVDFADNCRDEAAKALQFCQHDLTEPIPLLAGYGFCADVLEHIPPLQVHMVIHNIMRAANTVFFQISTKHDSHGELIGEYLHLTVRPAEWWKAKFEELGYHVTWWETRDIAGLFFVHNHSQGKSQ